MGLLATGPELFTYSRPMRRILDSFFDGEFSVTNSGIKVFSRLMVYTNPDDGNRVYFIGLGYSLLGERRTNELGIDLCLCGPNKFSRVPRPGLSVYPYADRDRTSRQVNCFKSVRCMSSWEATAQQATEIAAYLEGRRHVWLMLVDLIDHLDSGIIESLRLQSPASEHLYIAAGPGLPSGHELRKGAFVFNLVDDINNYFLLDLVDPHPSPYYHRANNLFFTLERPGFVGLLRMPHTFNYPVHDRILIFCGLNDASEPWCRVRKGLVPDPQSMSANQMMSWLIDNATETYVQFWAKNDLGDCLEVKLSVSVGPGTFPGIGFESRVQVHVVQIRVQVDTIQGIRSVGD
ncbi:hypothetical protein PG984_013037 [Apiospora sp. TS-2023a]